MVAFAFCPKIWEGAENISIDFFIVYTKLVEMALLASEDLTTAKKITSTGLDLMHEIITGLRLLCLTN